MSTTTTTDLAPVLDKLNDATLVLRRAGGGVPEEVERVVEALGLDLHADAPLRLDVDPYLTTALYAAALRAVGALRQADEPTRYRELRVALEQVRHAVRDIVDTAPFGDDQPVGDVAVRLAGSVNVPQAELAKLFGVSTRQWQRWLSGEAEPTGRDASRVRIVAQLANQLRHTFTGPGVVRWFEREHPMLGVAPKALLDDPLRYPELSAAARGSRTATG